MYFPPLSWFSLVCFHSHEFFCLSRIIFSFRLFIRFNEHCLDFFRSSSDVFINGVVVISFYSNWGPLDNVCSVQFSLILWIFLFQFLFQFHFKFCHYCLFVLYFCVCWGVFIQLTWFWVEFHFCLQPKISTYFMLKRKWWNIVFTMYVCTIYMYIKFNANATYFSQKDAGQCELIPRSKVQELQWKTTKGSPLTMKEMTVFVPIYWNTCQQEIENGY